MVERQRAFDADGEAGFGTNEFRAGEAGVSLIFIDTKSSRKVHRSWTKVGKQPARQSVTLIGRRGSKLRELVLQVCGDEQRDQQPHSRRK